MLIQVFRNNKTKTLNKILSGLLIFQLVFPLPFIQLAVAQIVSDPRAEIQFRPVINNIQGIPVVDIVRPNSAGLSHNQYRNFNVDDHGLVLNNSLVGGRSNLAGQLQANPNLGGRSASTILNEVTGVTS